VWAIIVIVIGSVAVIALIIFITIRKIKARRLLKAHLGANQYTNINSVPSQPYFNNNINGSFNSFNPSPPNPTYSNPPPYSPSPNVYNPIPNNQYGTNQFPSNNYVPPPINFQPKPV
jgi:hypothetical protein